MMHIELEVDSPLIEITEAPYVNSIALIAFIRIARLQRERALIALVFPPEGNGR